MPTRTWRCQCLAENSYRTGNETCATCGEYGAWMGWRLGMYELMARYQYVYGLKPIGPHRPLADRVLGDLRGVCERCKGAGVLTGPPSAPPIFCTDCEATGGFWTAQEHEISAAKAEVLRQFPDAAAPNGHLNFTLPAQVYDLGAGVMLDGGRTSRRQPPTWPPRSRGSGPHGSDRE